MVMFLTGEKLLEFVNGNKLSEFVTALPGSSFGPKHACTDVVRIFPGAFCDQSRCFPERVLGG